jgi:glycosyltransferase involved in cell wall biosynthesis
MKILSISARYVDFENYRKDITTLFSQKHEVTVACAMSTETTQEAIKSYPNIKFIPLEIKRGSLNILRFFLEILEIRSILKKEQPDVYIAYSFKIALLASAASSFLNVKKIHVLTGLGYTFTSNSILAKTLRYISIFLAKFLFKNSIVITLNSDDYTLLKKLSFSKKIYSIPGEGINPNKYPITPEPTESFSITYLGRFLKSKGICKFKEIADELNHKGMPVIFHLYGELDNENPDSITKQQLSLLKESPYIQIHPYTRNVSQAWAKTNLCILLSEREGFPHSILEAMACKRCVVASKIAGCAEILQHGALGILVDHHNINEIVEKISIVYKNPEIRSDYTHKAYTHMKNYYSAEVVANKYEAIFKEMIL